MISTISYQKYIDAITTRELRLPKGDNHQRIGTELATIDGVTYVSLPEGAVLPDIQPAEIAASIAEVALTDELRAAIKSASPHVKLINQRVIDKIREKYSADDEIKCLRLAPSAETTTWNLYVEDCRAWGQSEKAKLGL